jgi:hypothetical protein
MQWSEWFYFTQPANIFDPEPWRGKASLSFVGEPTFHEWYEDALSFARNQYAKEDFDVILLYAGSYRGHVGLLDHFDRSSARPDSVPRNFARVLLSSVEDAKSVVDALLDTSFSIRS